MLFGNNGIFGKADEAKFKTEIKALQETAYLYVSEKRIEAVALNNMNAGYENLVKWNYEVEPKGEEIGTIIKGNTKYIDQIVVSEGEFYYIFNKKQSDMEKVKWCFEVNVKVWGYDNYETFEEEYEEEYMHDGSYQKIKGIYMCIPDLRNFVKLHTRYVSWDDSGNEQIGTWMIKEPPGNWYDYKNNKWANVVVENNGKEAWYVWIPRYMYKIGGENLEGNPIAAERTDIRFVDVNNNWTNPANDQTTEQAELLAAGYKLPESFIWSTTEADTSIEKQIPGYWIAKYALSDVSKLLIDMDLVTGDTSVRVQNVNFPASGGLNESQIATYEYYITAKLKKIETNKNTEVLIEGLKPGTKYTVNLTAKDSAGKVLASMTKTVVTSVIEKPDISKFNQNTTFYVWWDDNGIEHNEVPITKPAPKEWYNYTDKKWANVVTRNAGKEAYFVWIPRYQYRIMNVERPASEQYTDIAFIPRTKVTPDEGYKLPESFIWSTTEADTDPDKQISGYWIAKYSMSDPTLPIIEADILTGDTSIRIGDIRTEQTDMKYEYYIDGNKMNDAPTNGSTYTYRGLEKNKTYTINIIGRKISTNEYVGAITKEVITIGPNPPDISKFNKDTSYYLTYDSGGNEVRTKMTNPPPADWYDYADKRWANIVTTNTAGTKEAYFVWIPRYQYRIMSTEQRADIIFIPTTQVTADTGYKIPESFIWSTTEADTNPDKQISGYWMSKYPVQ